MEKTMEKPDVQPVPDEGSGDGDKALVFAEQHRIGPLSDADNKRVLRKIDRHLLPLVCPPPAARHPFIVPSELTHSKT